ncbi:V-set and transmembrane domain-containing protein 4-like [Sinocyclocheilus grahami]|uniref:V-set and transmembrane domain-containing protein 4-like n=1 Tax=Sinocyclocheilus grahami TaxID=75366 RepID=UPI0007AD5D78|nr:PREDICTED: V-set and transmembrane domain-containing protein 4-like [Sinocyclocheilus grahami]
MKHSDVCSAINVTVTPSPFSVVAEGENITLSCQVSQRRRSTSLPVVRWMFQPESGGEELLVARVNMRRAKFYGNYTKSFCKPKIKLTVVKQGKIYNLLIMNISTQDRGLYSCRVQEFKKHHERWKASTNSSASTQLRGLSICCYVYLCAVLVCCVGLLCMCMFTIVVSCQYLQRKRRLKENYHLVKSSQNSSGETVTIVVSLSPALPKKVRKYKKNKSVEQPDLPPEIPAKAPIADKMRKPKLLKPQPRKVVLPKIAEESLTYAELELMKPLPEAKTAKTGTVYAQIFFEDKPPKIAEESLTYAELELMKPLPEAKTAKTGTVYAQIFFEDKPV